MNNLTEQSLLIRAKGIYNSSKHQVLEHDGLLTEGTKIRAIGSYAELAKSHPEAQVVDLQECYLFPGLINTHVHLEFNAEDDPRVDFIAEEPQVRFLRAAENANKMLRSGATTIRDAGSTWDLLKLHEPGAGKILQLPRLHLAGPPLTITGGHLHWLGDEADSMDELIHGVRLRQKRGCDAIKIVVTGGQMTPGSGAERTSYTIDKIQAIQNESRHLGLPTFAHCLTTEGFVNSVLGDVDCIEHVACFRRHKNQLLERVYEPEVMERFRGDKRYFMKGITCFYHNLDPYRSGEKEPTWKEVFWLEQERRMVDIFKKVVDLGLTPVLGTDAGTSHTYFDETSFELEIFVERCGISNKLAIDIGTVNSAASMGLQAVTGQLSEGFSADIIALRNNPLEDIRAFRKVDQVICQGTLVV